MTEKEYVKQVNRTTAVTLAGNAFLAVAKFLGGVFARSSALVSDAAQSLTDCFSAGVVIVGVHISGRRSDKDHPYGHERMECIAALILAAVFTATAIVIALQAIESIVAIAGGESPEAPSYIALITAGGSILVKGGLYIFTERRAKKLNSSALHGMAVDHLSDSLSSFGAIVGIVGAMCGVAVLDPVASLFISVMIVRTAWGIVRLAVDQLVDKAADPAVEKAIEDAVLSTDGVERIDVLRTRQYGNKVFVDLEIAVRADLSLIEAHRIAERVHARVEHEIGENIKHCMVHVNPLTGEDNHESPREEME